MRRASPAPRKAQGHQGQRRAQSFHLEAAAIAFHQRRDGRPQEPRCERGHHQRRKPGQQAVPRAQIKKRPPHKTIRRPQQLHRLNLLGPGLNVQAHSIAHYQQHANAQQGRHHQRQTAPEVEPCDQARAPLRIMLDEVDIRQCAQALCQHQGVDTCDRRHDQYRRQRIVVQQGQGIGEVGHFTKLGQAFLGCTHQHAFDQRIGTQLLCQRLCGGIVDFRGKEQADLARLTEAADQHRQTQGQHQRHRHHAHGQCRGPWALHHAADAGKQTVKMQVAPGPQSLAQALSVRPGCVAMLLLGTGTHAAPPGAGR